jgi:hypothetical protein
VEPTDDPEGDAPTADGEKAAPRRLSRRAVLVGGAAVGAVVLGVSAAAARRSDSRSPTSDSGSGSAGGLASTGAAVDPTWSDGLPAALVAVVESWAQSPAAHPHLGDWRRVGHRRGASDPQSPGNVIDATSRGIQPDQPGDVSGQLQSVLDELGASGGGVLRLSEGRYVLDRPLFIHDSNVVLRGAGKDKTTLFFTKPLADTVRPGTFWSWTGGQVYFTSRERLASASGEQFIAGAPLATVAPAPRGADIVNVDSTSQITSGAMLLLEIQDTAGHPLVQQVGGNVAGAATYDWSTAPQLNHATWSWPVVCTVVSPTEVRLEQPLRLAISADTTARLRPLGPTLHDSGAEGFTIENQLLTQTVHNQNPGSNGVCFQAAYDCWASDIRVLNADVAYSMTAAKSCTLTNVSAGGRAMHHFTVCRAGSHDNLIQDFHLEDFTVPLVEGAYTHGISVENMCSGNVWRRGQMDIGTFDSHRAMPFENLRTDITLVNKVGVPGGAFNAGPCYGTRFVHWGIHVTTDNNLCMGITDVAPRSLTAGITGITTDGSQLRNIPPIQSAPYFDGDLESQSLEFGTDLGDRSDLLDIQRRALPLG